MEALQHRSYRVFSRKGLSFWTESLILLFISIVSIYLYLTFFHNQFMEYFHKVLLQNGVDNGLISLNVYSFDALITNIPFSYSSLTSLLIVLIGLIFGVVILFKQKTIPLNVVFWIVLLIVLMSVFIMYFIFFSTHYPYSSEKYFDIYLHSYIGFMFMCFIALSFILALTPETLTKKIFILSVSIVYYFLFSFIRLACTILLVSQVSVVFSPFMYFTIFYDFILVVYIYTVMVYRNAKKINQRKP